MLALEPSWSSTSCFVLEILDDSLVLLSSLFLVGGRVGCLFII